MNKKYFVRHGFLQALGVFLYCFLVGLFMTNGEKLIGSMKLPFGPVLILLLFSTSVLVCAVLVFYKPYRLFVEGHKKEALGVVISTSIWLFVIFALYLTGMVIF